MQIQKVNNTNQKINFGMNVTTALEHFGKPHARIVKRVVEFLQAEAPKDRSVNVFTNYYHKATMKRQDFFTLGFKPDNYIGETPFVCVFKAVDKTVTINKKMNELKEFLQKYFNKPAGFVH